MDAKYEFLVKEEGSGILQVKPDENGEIKNVLIFRYSDAFKTLIEFSIFSSF